MNQLTEDLLSTRKPEQRSLRPIWPQLEAEALRLGASRIGVSSISDEHAGVFESWIAEGHAASMTYLEKNAPVRADPRTRFPWARSVLVIAVPYSSERGSPDQQTLSGSIARYAQGDDYHDVLAGILRELESFVRTLAPFTETRCYVDTGPLSDRAYGAQGGIGWIGKNSMLIDPERGSYFFLGTILTSLENDLDAGEIADRCGSCTRCIDACPTHAILPGRTVASERCISYATIEHRGELPAAVAERLEGNVFGCDICQEVCPWNGAAVEPHPAFRPRESYRSTPVTDLLRLSQIEFSALFRKSAVKRAKREGMMRNARLVRSAISS